MNKLIQLIRNEQMKLYFLRSTWIMLGILLVFVIGNGVLTKVFEDEDSRIQTDEWRTVLTEENESLEKDMEGNEFAGSFSHYKMNENEFYLENDIQPAKFGALHFVYDNSIFIILISLFTIIVAAGSVANEHRWGTIKLLLIRPISRSTILLSKYVSVLIFALSTTLLLLVSAFIVGLILFGFEGAQPMYLIETANGSFELISLYKEIFADIGFQWVEIAILATLAFMISTIFKNNSMALGTTLFLMFTGIQIVFWFEKYAWSKYILFAHTDLSQYSKTGNVLLEGNTLSFSIVILIIYYVLFLFLSWIFFTKRDVAGQ